MSDTKKVPASIYESFLKDFLEVYSRYSKYFNLAEANFKGRLRNENGAVGKDQLEIEIYGHNAEVREISDKNVIKLDVSK